MRMFLVATIADGTHILPGRPSRSACNARDADHGTGGGEFSNSQLMFDWITCDADVWLYQAKLKLRLRIAFSNSQGPVQDQVDFDGFPPGLTGGGVS